MHVHVTLSLQSTELIAATVIIVTVTLSNATVMKV